MAWVGEWVIGDKPKYANSHFSVTLIRGEYMKIFSCYFHHNGFFIQADSDEDFWVLLSKTVGWGQFCKIRDSDAVTGSASLFELRETRPASGPAPYPIVSGSNVLWHLQEACEVLKSV